MKKLVLLTFLVFLGACKNDSDSVESETPKKEPKKNPVLNAEFYTTYYNKNISPALTNLKAEVEKEVQYIQQFHQTKNTIDFELIKTQWLVCAKAYAKTRVYNFGLIKQRFFDKNIHNAPVSTIAIEVNIKEKTTYNTAYFNKKSTTTKGLGALEYLIYNDYNVSKALQLLNKNSYRLDYLLGVGQELLRQVNLLISTWEDGYKETFINSESEICTQNARCLSFNQLINILDITRATKIGKTAGFEKSDNLAPKNLEAFRSKATLVLIQAMLDEVKYVYQESDANIAAILDPIDSSGKISSEINSKFKKINQAIVAFNNNLFDAINTDATTLKPIYDIFGELVVLFSVDAASVLSVTVLPTDNDGD